MDAAQFAVGERIKLVSMEDPYVEVPIGITGTITGIAPKPVNILNVDWDGNFGLNPCLDVDVVSSI